MFSFAKLATVAFAAFGLVAAAPTPAPVTDLALVSRCGCETMPAVLVDLNVRLEPLIGELGYITSGNATKAVLTPLVTEIVVAVQASVDALTVFVGRPVAEILVDVDGSAQITLGDLAALVGGILTLVFHGCGRLLGLARVDVSVIIEVLTPLGAVIGALLEIVLKLAGNALGNLVGAIFVLIGDVVPVILQLGVSVCISIFAL